MSPYHLLHHNANPNIFPHFDSSHFIITINVLYTSADPSIQSNPISQYSTTVLHLFEMALVTHLLNIQAGLYTSPLYRATKLAIIVVTKCAHCKTMYYWKVLLSICFKSLSISVYWVNFPNINGKFWLWIVPFFRTFFDTMMGLKWQCWEKFPNNPVFF